MDVLEEQMAKVEAEIARVQGEIASVKQEQKDLEEKRVQGAGREAEDRGIALISHRKGLEVELNKLYEDKTGVRAAMRAYMEENDAAQRHKENELKDLEVAKSMSVMEENEIKRKEEEKKLMELESLKIAQSISEDGENEVLMKKKDQDDLEMQSLLLAHELSKEEKQKSPKDDPHSVELVRALSVAKGGGRVALPQEEKKHQHDADLALAIQLSEEGEEKGRRSVARGAPMNKKQSSGKIAPPAYDDDDVEGEIPPAAEHEAIASPSKKSRAKGGRKSRRHLDDDDDIVEGEGRRSSGLMRSLSEMAIMNQIKQDEELAKQIAVMGTVRDNVNNELMVVYRPIFTFIMLVVDLILFVVTMFVANWQFASLSVNPMVGPSATVLLSMGAKWEPYIYQGQYYRLFAPIVLHAGVIHLLLNGLMTWRLGSSIEETFGFLKTGLIYLIAGVSGVLASCVFNPTLLGVGASGALYGWVGALFGDFIQNHKTIVEGKWAYFFQMVCSLVVGLGIGLLPVIDNWAHIGGLVAGFCTGLILLQSDIYDEDGKKVTPWYSKCVTIFGAIALFLWFVVMIALVFTNGSGYSYCSWCLYLDCFNTSYWTC